MKFRKGVFWVLVIGIPYLLWEVKKLVFPRQIVLPTLESGSLPAYSMARKFNWEAVLRKLDTVTGAKAAEFEDEAGQPLQLDGWQTILSDSLFTSYVRDTLDRGGRIVIYIPDTSWSKGLYNRRRFLILSVDQFIEEIMEAVATPFDKGMLSKDPHYRPDRYDAKGHPLCNIYKIRLRTHYRAFMDWDQCYDFDIWSDAELWTPYKYKLGKYDPWEKGF
jgi:hypothetical protein